MKTEVLVAVIGAKATVAAAVLGNITRKWKPSLVSLAFALFTFLVFAGFAYHGYQRFERVCTYIHRYTDDSDPVFEQNKIERSDSSQNWFRNVAEDCL